MLLSDRLSLLVRMGIALVVTGVIAAIVALTVGFLVGFAVVLLGVIINIFTLGVLLPDHLLGSWPPSIGQYLVASLLLGIVLTPLLFREHIRDEIRAFEAELGCAGQPAAERHAKIESMVQRLAKQANIPIPHVRIVNRDRPETYAVADSKNGTIVVTRGVIRQLDDDEIESVLAHEVSHLANNDTRIMRWLLVPMLLAEHVGSGTRPSVVDERVIGYSRTGKKIEYKKQNILAYLIEVALWKGLAAISRVQLLSSQFGIAFLSRGREVAADTGAARLTGSPATLATALRKLDDARGRPSEDKREFMRTAGALDILPVEDRRQIWGPFRTHPHTEDRIARLESLAAELERQK
jgi:heat shock protein HtpX